MDTPGRCANTETCWIGNSGRTVNVPLGADFVCPGCHEPLRPPAGGRRAVGGVRRVLAFTAGVAAVFACGSLGARVLTGHDPVAQIVSAASSGGTRIAQLIGAAPRSAPVARPPPAQPPVQPPVAPAHAHTRLADALSADRTTAASMEPRARGEHAAGNAGRIWPARPGGGYGLQGRDWVVDGAPDPRPRPPAYQQLADQQLASLDPPVPRQEPAGIEPERTPLAVPNELAIVPPPKPDAGGVLPAQPAEAVRPPALFGRASENASDQEPPMAQLADLGPATAAELAAAETESTAPDTPLRARRLAAAPPRHTALRDALREALGTRAEHEILPVAAAPTLPRYPALFAQEYPVGRVSAVCLVAAAGSAPDCKVLGTGTSLSLTQSVGQWPVAGKVHYKAIAANARGAAAVWKPARTHS